MKRFDRTLLAVGLALTVAYCAGCGGGGGSASSPLSPPGTLSLAATPPDLAGKTGQTITIPVRVTGTGSVDTAVFDVTFNANVFGPAGSAVVGGTSVAITDPSPNVVCRYRWVDERTVRVMYASSQGIPSGQILVQLPVTVLSEATTGLELANIAVTSP